MLQLMTYRLALIVWLRAYSSTLELLLLIVKVDKLQLQRSLNWFSSDYYYLLIDYLSTCLETIEILFSL